MITTMHSFAEVKGFLQEILTDFSRIPFTPFMRDENARLADEHSYYFQRQAGPDGAGWAKNAPRTIKEKGHERILRGKPANGYRLSRSLSTKAADADAVRDVIHVSNTYYAVFGTDVEYSVWNNNGVPGRKLPARPHIGITVQYVDAFAERAVDYAFQKLVRAG